MMLNKVFISYAYQDKAYLEQVIEELQKRGIITTDDILESDYIDDIKPRSNIRAILQNKIQEASKVVVLWTDESAKSQFVNYEAGIARALDKPIFVIMSKADTNQLPIYLSDIGIIEISLKPEERLIQQEDIITNSTKSNHVAAHQHGSTTVKHLFTTREVANICKVNQQTIIRCFDSGKLEGFRIPGSKFRRIPRKSLIKFMKNNSIPLDNLESNKKKILIVDDDTEIVELMMDTLEGDKRFEVRNALTAYEAGVMTVRFRPDLILLDYILPDANATLICKTIKQNPEFADIRIIIISGVMNQMEIDDMLKAGAEEFIRKPFSTTDLIDKITVLLHV